MEKYVEHWFNTSPQGVAFLEPIWNQQKTIIDFRYKLVNKAFAQIVQQTQEELIGQIVKPATQQNDFFFTASANHSYRRNAADT
ncbi:hypothetical protein [Spirosoma foliorum]|uniref:PAS domain-containing protein n=1 Tax=Spirosoma foliorum TaxID=2710596 RepID=A0A7G5H1B5_9BACT|nr:hypothetical protein [Spirosoma foliorum]QMW04907.1 hypothetical protein H3H32_08400 [Spirosoma foliorum]